MKAGRGVRSSPSSRRGDLVSVSRRNNLSKSSPRRDTGAGTRDARTRAGRLFATQDCPPLFGQTEDQTQGHFASEILASPITIHGSRFTDHDSRSAFPAWSPCPPYITDPAPGTVIRKHWNDQSFRFVRVPHRPGDVGDDGQSPPTSHRCGHRPS
jgi:hypothetical protein